MQLLTTISIIVKYIDITIYLFYNRYGTHYSCIFNFILGMGENILIDLSFQFYLDIILIILSVISIILTYHTYKNFVSIPPQKKQKQKQDKKNKRLYRIILCGFFTIILCSTTLAFTLHLIYLLLDKGDTIRFLSLMSNKDMISFCISVITLMATIFIAYLQIIRELNYNRINDEQTNTINEKSVDDHIKLIFTKMNIEIYDLNPSLCKCINFHLDDLKDSTFRLNYYLRLCFDENVSQENYEIKIQDVFLSSDNNDKNKHRLNITNNNIEIKQGEILTVHTNNKDVCVNQLLDDYVIRKKNLNLEFLVDVQHTIYGLEQHYNIMAEIRNKKFLSDGRLDSSSCILKVDCTEIN